MDTSQTTFHYAVLNLPAFQLTMYVAVVLIMWFGGNMVLSAQLQVGDLTGFLSYVFQVMNSMMMISNVFLLLTRSLASARRISEVLQEEVELASRRTLSGSSRTAASTLKMSAFNTAARRRRAPSPTSRCISKRGRRWGFWAAPARPRAAWCS